MSGTKAHSCSIWEKVAQWPLSDVGVNIRNLPSRSSLSSGRPRAVYKPRAADAQAMAFLAQSPSENIVLGMQLRVLCAHHLLRVWRPTCC